MQKIILVLIICAFLPVNGYTQVKQAIIFGGNCNDEVGPIQSLMTRDMSANADSLRKEKWRPTILHDNDSVLKNKEASASKEKLIEYLNHSVNQLKAGDQLLITMQTHGKQEQAGKSHEICMNNGEGMPIDDRQFVEILSKAKEKGINLGILTDACYGGSAVEKLSSYGCILSTQSKYAPATGRGLRSAPLLGKDKASVKHYNSYQMGVTSEMTRLLEKSKKVNLGDVYLSSLINYNSELFFNEGEDRILGQNYPQFTGHNWTQSDDMITFASNFRKLKKEGKNIIKMDEMFHVISDPYAVSCSYSQITSQLDQLVTLNEELTDNMLFNKMMSEFSDVYAPKFESLNDFKNQFQNTIESYLKTTKDYDISIRLLEDISNKWSHSSASNSDMYQKQFREADKKNKALEGELVPLERKVTILYNILKAFDFYTKDTNSPCSSFSLTRR
jgi:hypothetical protein